MVYDMILFMGQSNMQGQSEKRAEPNLPVTGALEYRLLSDTWIPLCHPVGEDICYDGTPGVPTEDISSWLAVHALGGSYMGNTNLVPSFCRAYIEQTKKQVLAVHVARGSTKVAEWLPGSPCYKILAQKVRGAFRKAEKQGFAIGSVYAVWLQGESDALGATTTEQYKERLTLLKNTLKREFSLSRFGVIKVGAFANDHRDEAIFTAQEELCQEDQDFLMLTRITECLVKDPNYMSPRWRGHYNSDGLELIGKEAGTALATMTM